MTFDPKSLLTRPGPPAAPAPPKPMTVDDLAAKLAQISAVGMGGALIALPDGLPVTAVDLVAHGETPAHFILTHSARAESEAKLFAAAQMMLDSMRKIISLTDSEMRDGDRARDIACDCIFEATGEKVVW